MSSVLQSLAGAQCIWPKLCAFVPQKKTNARGSTWNPGGHAAVNRKSTGGRAYSWSTGCTRRRSSLQPRRGAAVARARHQRDHSALEHACTDAAAASHGRMHKSPPELINSHVADDSTTKTFERTKEAIPDGVCCVYKPPGWTSSNVVSKIPGHARAGHTQKRRENDKRSRSATAAH